jgi:hypothetical protein
MVMNSIFKKMTSVEKEILEVWKAAYPSAAYTQGFDGYAGKILVPSKKNLANVKKQIRNLRKKTTDKGHLKFLDSFYVDLEFFEPYVVPSAATGAFFYHMVKEGIHVEHMKSLSLLSCEALKKARMWLQKTEWSIEVRIVTTQKTNGLIGILNKLKGDAADASLKQDLDKVIIEAKEYKKSFLVEGVEEGDFTEVFPILQKQGGDIGHKKIYPKILKKQYDYPETADEIEEKALKWMKMWQPKLIETTRKLAAKYRVDADVVKVEEEMNRRCNVPKAQTLDFVKKLRTVAQKVFDKNVVKITPKYDTRIIETPPFLISFVPSGATSSLDTATDKPFNLFFVTTDEKWSPASNIPDLMQLILHEEYGHCVNFSNSATAFGAEPSPLNILETALCLPISDGISFHREFEFVNLLKELVKRRNLDSDEKRMLEILRGDADDETMVLENEYVMLSWRMVRFLRAVFDVRVNMGKQTIAEFVEWGSKETGISQKKIYDQTFIFLSSVGYAPCYSMAGEALRELQELAKKNGKRVIDFNTYASAMGFPGRTIFEEKLYEYATR